MLTIEEKRIIENKLKFYLNKRKNDIERVFKKVIENEYKHEIEIHSNYVIYDINFDFDDFIICMNHKFYELYESHKIDKYHIYESDYKKRSIIDDVNYYIINILSNIKYYKFIVQYVKDFLEKNDYIEYESQEENDVICPYCGAENHYVDEGQNSNRESWYEECYECGRNFKVEIEYTTTFHISKLPENERANHDE